MADQVLPKGISAEPWSTSRVWFHFSVFLNENRKDENMRQFGIVDMARGLEINQLEFCSFTWKYYWNTLKKTPKKIWSFFLRLLHSLSNKIIHEKLNNSKVLHNLRVKRVQIVSTGIQWQGWSVGGWPTRGRCHRAWKTYEKSLHDFK